MNAETHYHITITLCLIATLIVVGVTWEYLYTRKKEGKKISDAWEKWLEASVKCGEWRSKNPFANETSHDYQKLIAKEIETFENYLELKRDTSALEANELRALKRMVR